MGTGQIDNAAVDVCVEVSRRARQRAELTAFAQEALAAANAHHLGGAAVRHTSAAIHGTAELLCGADRLFVTHTFGLRAPGTPVDPSGRSVHAQALHTRATVARELTEDELGRVPSGLGYGAATPVLVPDHAPCVLAVYATCPFAPDDLDTLEDFGTILAAAGARLVVQQQLAHREAALRLVLAQLPVVVWTTDTHLELTTIRSEGIPEMELRARRDVPAMELALRGQTSRYSFALDGRTFDVRVDPLRAEDGTIRGTVAVAFDVTERDHAEAAIRASREELRRLTARMNCIEEEERRRIAREIHDEMGQRLTALHLELDLLRREIGSASVERVASMSQLIRDASETVRRIASDLRPSLLDDFGLVAAIENELAQLQRRAGIEYDLFLPDDEPKLDRKKTTALFRIVQEALTNVARHSGARHVMVTMSVSDEAVMLELRDDGRGITPAEADSERSLGLLGMRERAHALGGKLCIEGNPDGGSRVFVRLPLAL